MPFTRVESLPTVARVGGGAGRPAQVHPEGDALLAEGPGTYLIETLEHDGSEDGLKAAKNKAQAISRQLKNVDTSIRVVQRNYSDAIEVYAVVMTEDEQSEYAATLEARREARAAKAGESEAEADEDDEQD